MSKGGCAARLEPLLTLSQNVGMLPVTFGTYADRRCPAHFVAYYLGSRLVATEL